MATITITGKDSFDTSIRQKAIETIARTDTETLQKLAELTKLPGAAKALKTKFNLIKKFL